MESPTTVPVPTIGAIIVAAGRGRRLGGAIPKQYVPLGDRPALRRSVDVFLSVGAIGWVLPVINADDRALCDDALAGVPDPRLLAPVEGGHTRARSVRRGLESLAPLAPDLVLIHDAARPFVTPRLISEVIAALDGADGATAALPIVDALWQAGNGFAEIPVSREGLWRAQTPQGFRFDPILKAHQEHDGTGADDVSVARDAGLSVKLVLGSELAYKITTAADLDRALADARALDEAGADDVTADSRTSGINLMK